MRLNLWDLQADEPDIDDSQGSLVSTSDSFGPQAPTLSSSSLTGADPPLPMIWQTLNSFIPIFQLLGPKFVLDQNGCYYIHGLVDGDDLAILRDHTFLVTEFILTDSDGDRPNIASSAFFHIAQFLGPDSCLLPSLLHLRIIDADTYFPYLHLLHTPSLKTLEATNVSDHPNFFSFLTTLVRKVPRLESMILGPGRFPLESLQVALKFTYLRQLELRDVVSTMNFTFLQDVGSLPNLECFVIDTRTCEYDARIPEEPLKSVIPPTEHMAEVGGQISKRSPNIDSDKPFGNVDPPCPSRSPIYEDGPSSTLIHNDGPFGSVHPFLSRPISPVLTINHHEEIDYPFQPISVQTLNDTKPSTSTMSGFHQLKKFHVVGGLLLVEDMIAYIASNTLEDISITVIRLSKMDLDQEAEKEESMGWEAEVKERRQKAEEERRREAEEEIQQKVMEMARAAGKKKPKNKKGKRQQEAILKEKPIPWGCGEEQEPYYQEIYERLMVERLQALKLRYQDDIEERQPFLKAGRVQKCAQAIFDRQTESYTTLLQTVSSRWSANLKVVKFNQLDWSSQPLPIPLALPKQVYDTLFRHPKLEILDCQRWKLDSVEDFLLSLKSSSSKNLKQLHLPIDGSPNPAVSLTDLLDIAKAFPMLESLQCCIDDTLSPIPQYSTPATNALSHGLQTLFIPNNPTLRWDLNQILLVARHLYLMFPHIQTVDNVGGPNEDQWVYIHHIVQTFQTIRKDDLYRFS